jgi:hypothetical protein
MKQSILRAGLLGTALVLALRFPAQAATTRIPFSGMAPVSAVPDIGVEKPAGATLHITGMVMVTQTTTGNPMLDGPATMTLDMSFTPAYGGAWTTKEVWQPTAYPGEGFTCSASGGWDNDTGAHFGTDRCRGFGEHLGAWQIRMSIYGDEITGYLFLPGD